MDSETSWLFLMPGIQKHLGFMITLVWFGYWSTHDIQALSLSQYRVLINECSAHPSSYQILCKRTHCGYGSQDKQQYTHLHTLMASLVLG